MKYFFTLLLGIFSSSLFAQTIPTFISDSLDMYIQREMKAWEIPGLSIGIVKDGKVLLVKGYGVKEIGKNEAVDENTLFMIGSNTKFFTATTLAMLEAGGHADLDDKVQRWMPTFALRDPLASKAVTITDLLSHRLGFETFQGDFTYWTSNLSRAEVIQRMGVIETPHPFRTQWGYCNAAFVTAGELVPRIIGQSWEKTVKDSILTPLNMTRTTMIHSELVGATNAARAHSYLNGSIQPIPYCNIDNLGPAGSMASSAAEMTHWLLAQLDNGKYEGKQVIPTLAIAAPRTPQSIIATDPRNARNTHFYLYGLGLGVNDRAGKLVYAHTGGVNGFFSSVLFVPEAQFGVVILTNSDQNYFFQNLTDVIQDAFLGLPYQDFSARSRQGFMAERAQTQSIHDSVLKVVNQHIASPVPLERYAGNYENEVYGTISITVAGDHLEMHFSHHPNLAARLDHIGNGEFLCTLSDPVMSSGADFVPFHITKNKVTGFTLKVAPFIDSFIYEFKKK